MSRTEGPTPADPRDRRARRRYRRLLLLLPSSFRRRHGREMEDVFAESMGAATGGSARLRGWLGAASDIVRQAVRLRLTNRRASARSGPPLPVPRLLSGVVRDVRYAIRSLVHSPVYASVSILTLALAVGATTAVYSAVDAALFRPPAHVVDPAEIVTIYTSDYSGPQFGASSYPDFRDFLAGAPAIEAGSTVSMRPVNVSGADGVTRILTAELVSGNYFAMLGAAPFGGRWFNSAEAEWDSGAAVAVMSHGVWTRMFGGDPSVLGSEVRISGQPVTIIGLAPPGFGGGGYLPAVVPDLWLPPSTEALLMGDGGFVNRGSRGRLIRARLADSATIEAASAQIESVAAALFEEYPEQWTDVNGQPRRVTVTPDARMVPNLAGPARIFSGLLLGAVGLTLLIACANVATITLVRGRRRSRELAVRSAIGAGRRRLAGLVLSEVAVVCLVGGVSGLLLARAATGAMGVVQASFAGMPISVDISVGPRVALFALGVTVLTLIVVGLIPAFGATRLDLVSRIKPNSAGARGRTGLRNALVVAQVSASLVLLVGGGLLLRSIQSATSLDLGYATEGLATVTLDLAPEGYEAAEAALFFDRLAERVGGRPDVGEVALIDRLPLVGASRRAVGVEGYDPAEGEDMEFDYFRVSAGLVELVQMEVLEGRSFGPEDGPGDTPVAMVNRSFADRFWPGEEAVGRGLRLGDASLTVVGVLADADYRNLGEESRPAFFLSLHQDPTTSATLIAGTRPGGASELLSSLREEVRALDGDLPVASLRTMSGLVASALLPQRLGSWLLVAAGGLGLFLSVLGLYGVISYIVSERTREVGVRMALGAPAGDVLRGVLRRGLALAAFGVAIGTVVAVGVTRFLQSLLFGVSPTDPVVFVLAASAVTGVSLLATYVPARRAASVDPARTLRAD